MKRIAIFCDGTWNRADAPHGTNVVKLAQALEPVADDGIFQELFYVQGVGTGRGSGAFTRLIDRLGGGAFGWGLTENVEEAYRHLTFSHRPGDEIFIFGFSRGAYTARSLAGLIRASSIPPAGCTDKIPQAIDRYRSRLKSTHPDHVESFKFRHRLNPALTTSEKEEEWRRDNGLEPGTPIKIRYLGVWDTVGALGLPGHYGMLARMVNAKYDFHDTDLSRLVLSARHAVAVDERRATFPPALWDNLDSLNDRRADRDTPAPYRQEWFPGTHGSVGGGGDICVLSNAALTWIAEGATDAGLKFEPDAMATYAQDQDPSGPLDNKSVKQAGVFSSIMTLNERDRAGPDRADRVHASTRARWCALPGYRPKTLRKVADDLTKGCGG
ncbi:Peptidoglycan binding domain protein [Rhodovulum sp. P5]|uniref:DUF2235 domain-containing protein n=1 Tax=Rhodovulum sp. P5 TaxID=1564506 RepID=UPI0009C1F77C|nr:DUF2235 domain-containing protein [Rhodovulum sp. P5]ARE40041.1 Peptidoglycan binding domain protein [Rhodovulum sp. P5]